MEIEKLGPDDALFTWEKFEKISYEKYFSQSIQLQKFREFDRLEQDDLIIAQYAAKFEELFKCTPALIAEEGIRAKKFENGHRGQI